MNKVLSRACMCAYDALALFAVAVALSFASKLSIVRGRPSMVMLAALAVFFPEAASP